jgi:hypothetical protein
MVENAASFMGIITVAGTSKNVVYYLREINNNGSQSSVRTAPFLEF